MAKKVSPEEAAYFNAIHNIRIELPQSTEEPGVDELVMKLDAIMRKARGPITRQKAITQALDSINRYEPARQKLRMSIANYAAQGIVRLEGYPPIAGTGQPKKPGPLLVCPEKDCHYQQFLMAKGEEYRCPDHMHLLIPKPSQRRRKKA